MIRIYRYIILSMLSFLIFSCAKKKDENVKISDNEVIKIEFWHAMSGKLGDVLHAMVEDFNKTHPNIYVKDINMANYTALNQKLLAAARSYKLPAVAQAYEAWISNYLEDGTIVEPIETFINGEYGMSKEEIEDIYPVFIKTATFDGKLISMPFNKSVRAIYYNKKLFREAGLDDRTGPRTIDDFLKYTQKLTQDKNKDGKPEIYGTAMIAASAGMFSNLVFQSNGMLFDEKTQKFVFNDEIGVNSMKFLTDLVYKYKVAFVTTDYGYQNRFLAGEVGIIEGSSVSPSFMIPQMPKDFELGIAPVPYTKKPAMIVQGTNVVIFKDVTMKERMAAWIFVKWFTDTEHSAEWASKTFYVPIRKSATEHEYMQNIYKQFPGYRDVIKQIEYPAFEPQNKAWMNGRKALDELTIGLLSGSEKGDIKELLDKLVDKLNKELSNNNNN